MTSRYKITFEVDGPIPKEKTFKSKSLAELSFNHYIETRPNITIKLWMDDDAGFWHLVNTVVGRDFDKILNNLELI